MQLTDKFNALAVFLKKACRITTGLLGCFLCVYCPHAVAQLCSGLPIQPIVYESFGNGAQRPTLAGQITYDNKNGNCPGDGEYTITNFVDVTCFDSAWHAIPGNHTPGDNNGNFLLINAGYEGGAFYKQPVSGLCAGTVYEFSFWTVNLDVPGKCDTSVLPVLTAVIETEAGELVQTLDFGSIPETNKPVWIQYGGTFKTPDPVGNLVISLTNKKGGCGNDFAIDDIQVRQCSLCAPTTVYIPDTFTPNNDGINDELSIFFREPTEFDLKIYNRWGALVFTSNSPANQWNGTYANAPCSPGDYSWVINFKPVAREGAAAGQTRTGHVLLLR